MLFLVSETGLKKNVKREKDVGKHMIVENRFDNSGRRDKTKKQKTNGRLAPSRSC